MFFCTVRKLDIARAKWHCFINIESKLKKKGGGGKCNRKKLDPIFYLPGSDACVFAWVFVVVHWLGFWVSILRLSTKNSKYIQTRLFVAYSVLIVRSWRDSLGCSVHTFPFAILNVPCTPQTCFKLSDNWRSSQFLSQNNQQFNSKPSIHKNHHFVSANRHLWWRIPYFSDAGVRRHGPGRLAGLRRDLPLLSGGRPVPHEEGLWHSTEFPWPWGQQQGREALTER